MYDAAARPDSYLRSYAQEFATVEIDSTFYGTPPAERVRRWAASVPDGFSFSCKLPREITHERRMLDVAGLVKEFCDVVRGFGPKLACVLAQFDAAYSRAEEATFLQALEAFPRDLRIAFEFRDAAWYEPELQGALEERGFALALADAPFVPRAALAAALQRTRGDYAYVRFVGDRDAVTRFDRVCIAREADVAWWAQALRSAPASLRRVFGYVNNHYSGHSPATVRALYGALGVAHERPPRVLQTSLF